MKVTLTSCHTGLAAVAVLILCAWLITFLMCHLPGYGSFGRTFLDHSYWLFYWSIACLRQTNSLPICSVQNVLSIGASYLCLSSSCPYNNYNNNCCLFYRSLPWCEWKFVQSYRPLALGRSRRKQRLQPWAVYIQVHAATECSQSPSGSRCEVLDSCWIKCMMC